MIALAATASPAWAPTLATLELSTDRVRPGEEVSFRGWYYNDTHPVLIHWDRLDGPVLATVTPDTFGFVHNHFRSIAGRLTIPPDATPGKHQLVATQEFSPPGKTTWGVPARAEIEVGNRGEGLGQSVAAPVAPRSPSIATTGTPGAGELAGVAIAGAALAALLVGLAFLVRSRGAPA